MKKLVIMMLFFSIIAFSYLLGACARPVENAPPPEGKVPGETSKNLPARASWEEKWETLLSAAKKEGTVSVYHTWNPPVTAAITKAFKDKYGINVEFTPFERGTEFMARYQTETRAGLNLADVIAAGGASTLVSMTKPAGLLGEIEPLLALPEVLDPKVWRGGVFPFLDKDKQIIAIAGSAMRFVAYNTSLVKESEITSFRDVLKPQYKGKVTLNDPSQPGAGIGLFGHLAYQIWTEEEAMSFMRQLLSNDVMVLRDQRLQAEWLAQGKNAIALALDPNRFAELIKIGAPIAPVIISEGVYLTTGSGAIAVPPSPPHRNAAAVFINWLLSPEGQLIYRAQMASMSMRVDVSTEGLDPRFVPGPAEKMFIDTEDYVLKRGKLMAVAKNIFEAK